LLPSAEVCDSEGILLGESEGQSVCEAQSPPAVADIADVADIVAAAGMLLLLLLWWWLTERC
jgi:hypothetical protein